MNEREIKNFREIAEAMGLNGEYKIVVNGIVKAFGLPYERAVNWNKFFKGVIKKM